MKCCMVWDQQMKGFYPTLSHILLLQIAHENYAWFFHSLISIRIEYSANCKTYLRAIFQILIEALSYPNSLFTWLANLRVDIPGSHNCKSGLVVTVSNASLKLITTSMFYLNNNNLLILQYETLHNSSRSFKWSLLTFL